MAQGREVGRVALRWSYSSIKQPTVDVERLKEKLNQLRKRDPDHLVHLMPPSRAPLIKIQPTIGGYKAYSKEQSSESAFRSPVASYEDAVGYNRRLVRSFKSGASLLPSDQNSHTTPRSVPKKRASSMATIDLNVNASSPTAMSNHQTEQLLKRRRKPVKQCISDFMEVYGQLPRLNRNLQTKILQLSNKLNTGSTLPRTSSHRKLSSLSEH